MTHSHRIVAAFYILSCIVAAWPGSSAATPAGTAEMQAPNITADKKSSDDEALRQRLSRLQSALDGTDRSAKVAAIESGLTSDNPALRRMAFEAALDSRDPLIGGLALTDWLGRQKSLPVLLYATKEISGSQVVLDNLGPLTVTVDGFDKATGQITATMGAPGYTVAMPSATVGTLAQTALTLNSYGCQLALRLSGHRTLDGIYRCQSLPALVARIVVN